MSEGIIKHRIPARDSAAFATIGIGHQMEIRAMLTVFAAVDAAPYKARLETWETAIRAANAELEQHGIPTRFARQTLYGIRARFLASGGDWQELVDLRKVPDWSRAERRRLDQVPEPTVLWWKTLIEQFKGRATCMQQAHRRAIAIWSLDQPIPGYGEKPPAGLDGYPAGWSYSNFCRLCKRSKYEQVRGHTGAKAASNFAFHVPTTRIGLEVGQYYMLDDVWHDFKVKRTLKSAPMRLLELCALDLRSGKKVCYGLKPEVMDDETGTRIRLQERDMRFLLAALLSLNGYRPGGTTLVGERGTAVVRDDIQRILADATDGAIRFEASAIRDTPAYPGWYKARGGGNPRFKAALESTFNLTHNAMAMLAGQVGSNERVNAPEELHGREDVDKALVKTLAGLELSPEQALMIRAPFLLLSQAERIIHALYTWLDGRTEHDLEGWEQSGLVTGEVRMDPRLPGWTPIYALAATSADQQAAVSALMQLRGCYRLRRLSPAEVWERDSGQLVRLPAHVLPALIGRDLAEERRVNDHGSFHFEDTSISPEPLRYVGIAVTPRKQEVMLREGETYLTFCNPFDPRFLLVCDSHGAYVGRCARVERACRSDSEALALAMGQAAHVNALRARAFLARHTPEALDREAQEAENLQVIETSIPRPADAAEQEARVRVRHNRVSAAGDLSAIYGTPGNKEDEADGISDDEQLVAAESLSKLY